MESSLRLHFLKYVNLCVFQESDVRLNFRNNVRYIVIKKDVKERLPCLVVLQTKMKTYNFLLP